MTVDTHATSTPATAAETVRQAAPGHHQPSPQDQQRPARVAFYGRRVSGDTPELANQSLTAQYLACLRALPTDARLTAVNYDLGPAARTPPPPVRPPDRRRATRPPRRRPRRPAHPRGHPARFDHVILADASHLTRDASESLKVIQRHADLGVHLLLINRAHTHHVVPLDQATVTLLAHLHQAVNEHLSPPGAATGPAATCPTTGTEQDVR